MNINIDKFKVKELMAQRKINTQSELAKMLGISKNQLSSILSDKFNPIKSNIVELANFFEVSPLCLLEENNKMEQLTYEHGVDNIFDFGFMDDFTTILIWEEDGNDISELKYEDKDDFYCLSEEKVYTQKELFKKFNIKHISK